MSDKLLHEHLREYAVEHFIGDFECGNTIIDSLSDHEALALADEIERFYIPRPRFEDGEPVQFGDEYQADSGRTAKMRQFCAYAHGGFVVGKKGKRAIVGNGKFVKRPAAKVLDADGIEINVGDVVWSINNGCEHEVIGLPKGGCYQSVEIRNVTTGSKGGIDAPLLTHTKPVFDADGERIWVGDIVWTVDSMAYSEVKAIVPEKEASVGLMFGDGGAMWLRPDMLTHREPDSLEKLRDDMREAMASSPDAMFMDSRWVDRLTALMERGA